MRFHAHILALAGLMAVGITAIAADEKPKTPRQPGWIVVEEDVWFPLRFAVTNQFHAAREQFRQKEEKAAAKELIKAAALLKIAHGHSTPEGAKVLESASDDMARLAKDLDKGKIASTRRFEATLHKLHYALAAHHYFKANDHIGNNQMKFAGEHLETAAHFLQNAMASAEREYGKEIIERVERIDEHGRVLSEGSIIEKNQLVEDLRVLKEQVDAIGETLEKIKPTP
ncbi:hypothetical protein K2X85_20830 [bacterium]|nr:hypothetical protein [bacterium]